MKTPKKVKDDSGKLLSPRDVLWAQAYAATLSIKEASEQIGLTPAQGFRIGRKPKVKRYIRMMMKERAAALGITQDRIMLGLLEEANDRTARSSHSARVAAWSALAKTKSMFTEKMEVSGRLDGTSNVQIFLPHNGREEDIEVSEPEENPE